MKEGYEMASQASKRSFIFMAKIIFTQIDFRFVENGRILCTDGEAYKTLASLIAEMAFEARKQEMDYNDFDNLLIEAATEFDWSVRVFRTITRGLEKEWA